jgi:hypothetical protein
MWTTRCCEREVRGTKPEHCPDCHETFATTEAGDRHRTGPHKARRCRTPVQMGRQGLALNAYGYWTLARNLAKEFP